MSDNPYLCNIVVNSVEIKGEIDTGAERTLVCGKDYEIRKRNTDVVLNNKNIPLLRSYSGDLIPTLRTVDVSVKHNNNCYTLQMIVVKTEGSNLLGRDWLNILKLDWTAILNFQKQNPLLMCLSLTEVLVYVLTTSKH